MSKFGWSLPAGCDVLPGEETGYCEVCGKTEYTCVCPECVICGEVGNKKCYEEHGMVVTEEQILSLQEEKQKYLEELNSEQYLIEDIDLQRDIPFEQLLEEVFKTLQKESELGTEELAERLNVDVALVEDAVFELLDKGNIHYSNICFNKFVA